MIFKKRRNEFISINDVGKIFIIHNGKISIKLKPSINMVGHKFGEFILTRTIIKKKL
jgi:ribosomal protein S19